VAMVCHGELARTRPPALHLTEFYLWMSVGGAIGGLGTAIVAPPLVRTLLEYRVALVLACLLTPRLADARKGIGWADIALPGALAGLVLILVRVTRLMPQDDVVPSLILFGIPALVFFAFRRHPLRFGLSVGALLVLTSWTVDAGITVLYRDRSFFGVYRVVDMQDTSIRALFHGTTIHGAQNREVPHRREQLLYYDRG